jgi:transposase
MTSSSVDGRAITPNTYAKRLGVSIHKILAWIRRGELRALNVANDTARRPQWKIMPEALAAFEAKRAAVPTTKPARRRSKKDPAVIEFF